MVANLIRYSACKVHADSPDRPIRDRKSGSAAQGSEREAVQTSTGPTRDKPVRLFVWVSA